jgi:hypothetical protein
MIEAAAGALVESVRSIDGGTSTATDPVSAVLGRARSALRATPAEKRKIVP